MNRTQRNDLISNLAFHAAWITVEERFLRLYPRHKAASTIKTIMMIEHDMMGALAHAMRQYDMAPNQVEPDAKIISQAYQRKSPETLLRYIEHGMEISRKWYLSRLIDPEQPLFDLWHTLAELQESIHQEIQSLY